MLLDRRDSPFRLDIVPAPCAYPSSLHTFLPLDYIIEYRTSLFIGDRVFRACTQDAESVMRPPACLRLLLRPATPLSMSQINNDIATGQQHCPLQY